MPMYEEFFEMKNTPFSRSIPVDVLYHDKETDEVFDRLRYAAQNRLFATLIGDSGAGKTTMLRRLRDTLNPTDYKVVYLTDSKMSPKSFYNGLLDQLGCERICNRSEARKRLHHEAEVMRAMENRTLVVIVDEGHLLSREMLDETRFLLNYKMDSENPLALIVSGQTELWDKLKLQAFRSVRNRIEIACFLGPLDFSQTKRYIEQQLVYSGHVGAIFTDEALQKVYAFSSGVPRLINRACTQSLNYAYQNRKALVDDRMVELILEEEIA